MKYITNELMQRAALATDILDSAEVMQDFDDALWIKVDARLWEEYRLSDDIDHSSEMT